MNRRSADTEGTASMSPPLRRFIVKIGPKDSPLVFEVMSTDAEACYQQHADLAGLERMEVEAV